MLSLMCTDAGVRPLAASYQQLPTGSNDNHWSPDTADPDMHHAGTIPFISYTTWFCGPSKCCWDCLVLFESVLAAETVLLSNLGCNLTGRTTVLEPLA